MLAHYEDRVGQREEQILFKMQWGSHGRCRQLLSVWKGAPRSRREWAAGRGKLGAGVPRSRDWKSRGLGRRWGFSGELGRTQVAPLLPRENLKSHGADSQAEGRLTLGQLTEPRSQHHPQIAVIRRQACPVFALLKLKSRNIAYKTSPEAAASALNPCWQISFCKMLSPVTVNEWG